MSLMRDGEQMSIGPYPWYPWAAPVNTSPPIARQTEAGYLNYLKTKAFEDVGYFLINYVVSGGEVVKNITYNNMIDVSDIVVSLNNDVMTREATSFKTTSPNSTYFLDFKKEGDFSWGTTHPEGTAGTDYLPVAQVTTDVSSNVDMIVDERNPFGGFRLKPGYPLGGYLQNPALEDEDMNGHQIKNLNAPTDPHDAIRKVELDDLKAEISAIVVDIEQRGINVCSSPYNADPTGVSDSSTAIQEAINACHAAGGGVVLLPFGEYLINTMILTYSNVYITGEGATINSGSDMAAMIKGVDASNVQISNLSFDGKNKANTLIHFQTVGVSPENITIEYCKLTGTKTDNTLFLGAVLFDAAGGQSSGLRHKNVLISKCEVRNVGTHGFLIAYSDGVTLERNVVDTVHNHGMETVGCTNVRINQNDISNCTLSGCGVGSHTLTFWITKNHVVNCGGDGAITAEHNSVDGVIAENIIDDATAQGINVSFGSASTAPFNKVHDVKIARNIIRGKSSNTTGFGINAYSSTGAALGEDLEIVDNTIEGFNNSIRMNYWNRFKVRGNTFSGLVGTAGTKAYLQLQLCTNGIIAQNNDDASADDHCIKLINLGASICTQISIQGNQLSTSGASKSFVYVEGAGIFYFNNNYSLGATSYINGAAASTWYVVGNASPYVATIKSGSAILGSNAGNIPAT